MVHHAAFTQLEFEQPRVVADAPYNPPQLADQSGVIEMTSREVHGELQPPRLRMTQSLRHRGVQNPALDCQDEVALFREPDEVVRRHDSLRWMLPPHEGLEPVDFVAVQVDNRLKVDEELAAFGCAPQGAGKGE